MEEKLHIDLDLRLFAGEKRQGPGLGALLHRIRALHSLRAACASLDMTYSRAWNTIREAEERLGFPLLRTATGGRHGGGASLTREAEDFLGAYDGFCAELCRQKEALFEKYLGAYRLPEKAE